mgnify:CR=1 FL=1
MTTVSIWSLKTSNKTNGIARNAVLETQSYNHFKRNRQKEFLEAFWMHKKEEIHQKESYARQNGLRKQMDFLYKKGMMKSQVEKEMHKNGYKIHEIQNRAYSETDIDWIFV